MKNFFVFLGGMVTGALLLLVISFFLASSSSESFVDDGITLFSDAGEIIEERRFEVLQVIESGNALATVQKRIYADKYMSSGMIVLFLADESGGYYDNKIIKVPSNKCVSQIGTYKYMTTNGTEKTVPIVDIFDK